MFQERHFLAGDPGRGLHSRPSERPPL